MNFYQEQSGVYLEYTFAVLHNPWCHVLGAQSNDDTPRLHTVQLTNAEMSGQPL